MRNNLKRKTWFCAIAMMGVTILMPSASTVFAKETIGIEVNQDDTPEVEPRTAKIDWVYKVIDGHLYKRLYNYTTGEWESDWILIE